MKKAAIINLKKDLKKIHNDWQKLKDKHSLAKDETYLKKLAQDLKKLDQDAKKEKGSEWAELIHHLLTTPWGAPFVSETTLLEAANSYDPHQAKKSSLHVIMKKFSQLEKKCDAQIFKIFDDISLHLEED